MKLFLVIAMFSGCSGLVPTSDAAVAATDASDAATDQPVFVCIASGAACSGDYPCCVGGCMAIAGVGSFCQ